MLDVSSKEFLFFRPTEPLTKALVEQNQRLVAESLHRVSPADELRQTGFGDDESEGESVVSSFPRKVSRRTQRDTEEPQTKRLQRLIGERLYHYLATLAESPYAREGGRFDIWEYIPQGVANTLGLAAAFTGHQPKSEQAMYSRHLLEKLTVEFRDWLVERHRSYVCAWGEIHLDEKDRLMLQMYAFDENLAEEACGQEASA
jgi:hypothetical protein